MKVNFLSKHILGMICISKHIFVVFCQDLKKNDKIFYIAIKINLREKKMKVKKVYIFFLTISYKIQHQIIRQNNNILHKITINITNLYHRNHNNVLSTYYR